jgi:hypothetical protein
MHLTILSVDNDGETHFADADIAVLQQPFAPPAPPVGISEPIAADQALFFHFPAGWYGQWHPVPRRQYYVQTTGELEVQVSDGEIRRFHPGDVVLVEDVNGRGHTTRVVGDDDVCGVFIQL